MRKPASSVPGAAIGLALCAACTSSVIAVPPANGGAHQNGAGSEGIPAASTTSYAVAVGATVPIAPGTQAGYALTASALMTYQLRWTGDASIAADGYKEFYGSAWTTGHFTSLTPGCVSSSCPLEAGDYVSGVETVVGGERIDWDTFASEGWDGFGFVTDAEPVYFDVFIDGNRLPQLVSLPVGTNATPSSPASSPFGVTSAK